MGVDKAISTATERFASPVLRPYQSNAIKRFVEGHDVFVNMRSGKSMCYALLPWTFDVLIHGEGSIAIVILPLKALMNDQVL